MSDDDLEDVVVAVPMELFPIGFFDTYSVLLYLSLILPSIDYLSDIANIWTLMGSGVYSAIGWIMLFNFLITPTIIACYRQNQMLVNKIQD